LHATSSVDSIPCVWYVSLDQLRDLAMQHTVQGQDREERTEQLEACAIALENTGRDRSRMQAEAHFSVGFCWVVLVEKAGK
jgi:hypothetical protein